MRISTSAAICVFALAATTVGGCATVNKARARFLAEPARCEAMSFPIYFKDNSDALTESAMQMISASAAKAKACKISAVHVIGVGDAKGGAAADLDLSKRRAKAVADALTANGFPAPTDSSGSAPPTPGAPRGASDPSRQRAEVQVSFAP